MISDLDLYNDIESCMGLLKNLDLFISVSNSTAHIAGALGVKTLLIKPKKPNQIEEAIVSLIDNTELRKSIILNGRMKASHNTLETHQMIILFKSYIVLVMLFLDVFLMF